MDNIVSGIFCPACKMRNDPGVDVCAFCNTPIEIDRKQAQAQSQSNGTGLLSSELEDILGSPIISDERFMDFELPRKGIALISLDDGRPVAMQDDRVFILGRKSEGIDTSEPLVDLTNFGALEAGISRLHAMVRKTNDGYNIIDLNSSNGTWLENQRLVPKEPYPLSSGDRIRLGRINILVFIP